MPSTADPGRRCILSHCLRHSALAARLLLGVAAASRKTLIYLILTLNHIYPDYDFSQLRAHHFKKEAGLARAEELVDTHMLEVSKVLFKRLVQ